MKFGKSTLVVALLVALVVLGFAQVPPNPMCILAMQNTTVNLNMITPATYTAPIVGAGGLSTTATVAMGWCQTVNSTACNAVEWSMAITAADGSCIVGFQVLNGPVQPTTPNGADSVTLIMWDANSGALANVVIACDKSGSIGKAKLVGTITNAPIYTYNLQFTSVHACPHNNSRA